METGSSQAPVAEMKTSAAHELSSDCWDVAYDIHIPFDVLFMVPFSIVLGLVHTYHSHVYNNVDNIWLNSVGVIGGALVIHGLLWFASRGWMEPVTGKPSEDDDDETSEDEDTVGDQQDIAYEVWLRQAFACRSIGADA
ncbi:unknown protein [Seminavis robusta]|uniref:Uncharacterized protein n=1 Tax=Seminavis robusta TaxID=568900 RepID=A0A9N8HI91_9STRA|nr:unknown protein [Seminavis robusta]|eukprot:Sro487_g152820.1 n/a (139) ;mRNA; f:19157-19686